MPFARPAAGPKPAALPLLTVLTCGNCGKVVGEAALTPGLHARLLCRRCHNYTVFTVPAQTAPAPVGSTTEGGGS